MTLYRVNVKRFVTYADALAVAKITGEAVQIWDSMVRGWREIAASEANEAKSVDQ
jgi:hypothetical protein